MSLKYKRYGRNSNVLTWTASKHKSLARPDKRREAYYKCAEILVQALVRAMSQRNQASVVGELADYCTKRKNLLRATREMCM